MTSLMISCYESPGWSAGSPVGRSSSGSAWPSQPYQVGKLILFGQDENDQRWSYNRNIARCLGLCVDGDGFRVTNDMQLTRFDTLLPSGQPGQNCTDALYAPRFFCRMKDMRKLATRFEKRNQLSQYEIHI